MRLLVVGGKLQGTEAAYLAAKAGWDVILVDRREAPPAAGIATWHVVADVTTQERLAKSLVTSCDAVLPACENLATLEWLATHVPAWDVPLLFDLDAYRVSESKASSRRLFEKLAVPLPSSWPACGFPVVVKPDSASGSDGVSLVRDEADLEKAVAALRAGGHVPLIEEYVAGPSLSIEVVAAGGRSAPLQVTGLEFDAVYDCKRVVAPVGEAASADSVASLRDDGATDWACAVAPGTLDAFGAVGARLAEGLGLTGLMDVEVMVRGVEPMVLEIDARLPSQTPTAVYHSCGLNIVELLHDTIVGDRPPDVDVAPHCACVYQHIHASAGRLEVAGEHVMSSARPLTLVQGFFGVDEALTDYRPGADGWSATLICTAPTQAEARARANEAVRALASCEGLETHLAGGPEGEAEEGKA